jgi:hypothetical protein
MEASTIPATGARFPIAPVSFQTTIGDVKSWTVYICRTLSAVLLGGLIALAVENYFNHHRQYLGVYRYVHWNDFAHGMSGDTQYSLVYDGGIFCYTKLSTIDSDFPEEYKSILYAHREGKEFGVGRHLIMCTEQKFYDLVHEGGSFWNRLGFGFRSGQSTFQLIHKRTKIGHDLYFPLWFPILLTSLPLIRPVVRIVRRRKDHKAGLCAACGYDLRTHKPGQRCPECGTIVPVNLHEITYDPPSQR